MSKSFVSRVDYSAVEAPFPSVKNSAKSKKNISVQCTINSRSSRKIPLFVQDKTGNTRPLVLSGKNSQQRNSVMRYTVGKSEGNAKSKITAPPSSSAFEKDEFVPDDLVENNFELFYIRSDLPVRINYCAKERELEWATKNLELLDFAFWVPIFLEGLTLTNEPFCFICPNGLKLLVPLGGSQIAPVLPKCIDSIVSALNHSQPSIIAAGMNSLQLLAQCHADVGAGLIPYYPSLLPYLGKYGSQNLNIGDAIEYGQNNPRSINLGALATDTIRILETFGGSKAFDAILKIIPTHQSV